MEPYPPEVEAMMKKLYQTLSEKDKRRYAAVEALKLGHGGQSYVAQLLSCSRNTIAQGIKELADLPDDSVYERRIRRVGGGRKGYAETYPDIDEQFQAVMADHTAGDPMDEQVRWTNLSRQEIADRLAEQHGVRVSVTVIKQLLEKYDYRQRKAQKKSP
jgi:ribosomal protein S24E